MISKYSNWVRTAISDSDDNRARRKRRYTIAGMVVLVVVMLIVVISSFLEGWVRRIIEDRMNLKLEGYSVQLAELDIHFAGLAVTLRNLVITQDVHPEPPVAKIAELRASVEWRQLLRGRLFASFILVEPFVYLNLTQLKEEIRAEVPTHERGWQDALEAAYFLDLNLIEIRDGELTYIDDPERPLHASSIQFRAEGIRTARNEDERFPSAFEFEGRLFNEGYVAITGNADFLAKPQVAVTGRFHIENVPLDHFRPVLERIHIMITNGYAEGDGQFELGAGVDFLHIENLRLSSLKADYLLTEPAGEEPDRAEEVEDEEGESGNGAVRTVVEGPEMEELQLRIDQLVVSGEFGFVNHTTDPPYRVFLQETRLSLTDYSNHFLEGPAGAKLEGWFMGSGRTQAHATFRPEQPGADFDLALEIRDTDLTEMNDLLQAYGDFDVKDGYFSLFSELKIESGHIEGYLRPLFRGIEVYESGADEDDGLFDRLYRMAVGVIARMLENIPRDEVATHVEFSGPLKEPEMSTLQIISGLIRNAFFRAILPGFEAEVE